MAVVKYKSLNKLARASLINIYKRKNPDISEEQADKLADKIKHLVRKK